MVRQANLCLLAHLLCATAAYGIAMQSTRACTEALAVFQPVTVPPLDQAVLHLQHITQKHNSAGSCHHFTECSCCFPTAQGWRLHRRAVRCVLRSCTSKAEGLQQACMRFVQLQRIILKTTQHAVMPRSMLLPQPLPLY